jgi:hypothetical protein
VTQGIQIDHQHSLSPDTQGVGQIDGRCRLANPSFRIGNRDNGTLPAALGFSLAHDFLLISLGVGGVTDGEFAA